MKKPLLVLIGLAVLGAAIFGAVKLVPMAKLAVEAKRHQRKAAAHQPAAAAAWAKEFGNPNKMIASFPPHPDDATAVRLIALAETIGIDLVRPKGSTKWWETRPTVETAAVRKAIHEYDDHELSKPRPEVAPPAADVQRFLGSHSADIDKIVDFLSTSAPPVWAMDVRLGAEAPVPNLLGQFFLHRLLVARALSDIATGNWPGAEKSLTASQTLNKSIRSRPEVTCQIVAIAVARQQAGLLRKLGTAPVLSMNSTDSFDYRASLVQAMVFETASIDTRADMQSLSEADRAVSAEFLDFQRRLLSAFRDGPVSDVAVTRLLNQLTAGLNPAFAGDSTNMLIGPNNANVLNRALRLSVDIELTSKVLTANAVRRRTRRWPASIPGIETSCLADAHWIYESLPSGGIKISLSRPLHFPKDMSGLVLPLTYESD